MLRGLGLAPEVDAAGNVVCRVPGEGPEIVMSAHMDCVQPCEGVRPVIRDGVIYSDGSTVLGGDDKVGVAAILEAARVLCEEGRPHAPVLVVFTVQEEVGLKGAAALSEHLFEPGQPAYVFDMDQTPGGAVVGAPYHYNFTATFTGVASHAGVAPEKGVSAVLAASRAVALMAERGCLGRVAENAASNVGSIAGGTANNVVPAECVLHGECRAVDAAVAERTRAAMEACLQEGAAAVGACVASEWTLEYPGFLFGEDSPTVQLFFRACRSLGIEPSCQVSAGGSDANILFARGLAPIVVATGMTNFHSTSECLRVCDLEDTFRIALALAYEARETSTPASACEPSTPAQA